MRFPVRRSLWGRVRTAVHAVNRVSLEIPRGTTLGLVGESGCGKSTLGRAMLRLIEPTSGRITFDGINVRSASRVQLRALRRHMQIIFQDPIGSLNPRMRAGAIIAEPLAIHRIGNGKQRRRLAADILARVGLASEHLDRFPHEFSGGQRQRIAIARALVLQPKFIVCDEPVSALDVSVQAQVLNLLADLKRELRLTLFFVSHNLAVVRHISDHVAVMYFGRIVEQAPAAELFTRPRHPYTLALIAPVPEVQTSANDRESHDRMLGGRRHSAGDGLGRDAWSQPGGFGRDTVGSRSTVDPPDPLNPPTGCAYHPRCPFATEVCGQVVPMLQPLPHRFSHGVACHHAEVISAPS